MAAEINQLTRQGSELAEGGGNAVYCGRSLSQLRYLPTVQKTVVDSEDKLQEAV
jgi:hypothetical protein